MDDIISYHITLPYIILHYTKSDYATVYYTMLQHNILQVEVSPVSLKTRALLDSTGIGVRG